MIRDFEEGFPCDKVCRFLRGCSRSLQQGVFAIHLYAQTFYGSIVGDVKDASGAAITEAKITLTNTGTGERRAADSDASGGYRFVNLVPGSYRIDVEKTGFKHYTRDQIPVEVEAVARIDATLEVGDVSQAVEVSASAPLLQTENASISQVVNTRSVEELPLNGRNVLNLVSLSPSVVPQGSSDGNLTGRTCSRPAIIRLAAAPRTKALSFTTVFR